MKTIKILRIAFILLLLVCILGLAIIKDLTEEQKNVGAGLIVFSLTAILVVYAIPERGMQATKLRRSQDLEKFEEIYKKLQEIDKNEIEPLRRERNRKRTICIIAGVCVYAVIMFLILAWDSEFADVLAYFVTMLALYLPLYITSKIPADFYNFAEEKIMSALIKEMAPTLTYVYKSENKEEALEMFNDIGLVQGIFRVCEVNDEIRGPLEGCNNFRLFDLTAQKNVIDTGKEKTTEERYGATLTCSEMQHMVKDEVRIYPKLLRDSNQVNSQREVVMDNEEFSKIFDVYSNNRVLAMQILTSDVMQKIIDIVDKYGLEFYVTIKENKVYVFFNYHILDGAKIDKESLYVEYGMLNYTLDVVSIINKAVNNAHI